MSNSKDLDQFYTKPEIAEYCVNKVKEYFDFDDFDLFLEPSAGNGSFYNLLPSNKEGVDLDPKISGIIKSDFFEYHPNCLFYHKILSIGNPPFGGNGRASGSLAIDFINKCLTYGPVAFILPISFNRPQMQTRVDKSASLIHCENLPTDSFTLDGKSFNVPCVLQIWVPWLDERNQRLEKFDPNHENFILYGHRANIEDVKPEEYDFVIRVWGEGSADFRIGKTLSKEQYENRDNKLGDFSVYYVVDKTEDKHVRGVFEQITYEDIKHYYGASPRLTAPILVHLYRRYENPALITKSSKPLALITK